MPIRGALSLSLLLLLAVSTVGCPAPTGRRRGVDSGTGGCSEPTQPFSGFPCRRNNETCTFEQPCGFNGLMDTTCTCLGGIWNCGSTGICQVVVQDAGPMECPRGHDVQQGEPCVARQGGLYCPGIARACDDSGTVSASCYCTGTIWSCRATGCNDAGPPACPPSPPSSLDTCTIGMSCFYSAGQAHTMCPLSCFCDGRGSYTCFQDCSLDVPEPDATDVTDESDVMADDAGDADDASDAADDVSVDDAIDDVDAAVSDDVVDDASKPADAGDLDATE